MKNKKIGLFNDLNRLDLIIKYNNLKGEIIICALLFMKSLTNRDKMTPHKSPQEQKTGMMEYWNFGQTQKWSPTGKACGTSIGYPPTPRLRRVIRLQRNPPKQPYLRP